MMIYQTEVETHDGNIKTLDIDCDSLIELLLQLENMEILLPAHQ